MIIKIYWTMLLLSSISYSLFAQEGLLSLVEEEETIDYATASFKGNRVINFHSLENTAKGVFDFRISHRFGFVNGGFSELFGLDAATVRIGGDYGITDQFMIGVGRSSYEKTFDGFLKYKFFRQSSGAKNMPVTAAFFASTALKSIPYRNPDRENHFRSRLYYTGQLIVGRKFSENFSFQLSPTIVHRNLVQTKAESNSVYSIGAASRMKLSKRVAINAEYVYVFSDQLAAPYKNALSIGFDIETGGHVFQLHFSNSTSMIEKGVVTETVGDWLDGGVHFGFNISRVFTIVESKNH